MRKNPEINSFLSLFLILTILHLCAILVQGRAFRTEEETPNFQEIQNAMPHVSSNELSLFINHVATGSQSTMTDDLTEFDYNISKLFYSMGHSSFVGVWSHFQSDNHVHNNEAFSIAVMDFVSRYFGFELSKWLTTDSMVTIGDPRIQKYMGLGLRDSQISGSSLLDDLIQHAGNSDVFSTRKSICQRVLMFVVNELEKSIERMPSLFSCATLKEIEAVFGDGNLSGKRLEIVTSHIGSLSDWQKDALTRQLNKDLNYRVNWRNTGTVSWNLSEFDFNPFGMNNWPLSKALSGLPYLTAVKKTNTDAKWATLLLQLFSKDKMQEAMGVLLRDDRPKLMAEISEKLCDQFTIYQRAQLSEVMKRLIRANPLYKSGWTKEDKKRFSCFLQINPHSGTYSYTTLNIDENSQKTSIQQDPHKTRSGYDWNAIGSLDKIIEILFYNSSQVTTRTEAVEVVSAIRREFMRSHGTILQSISELSRHQLNAIPAFILREFWTFEFNFNSVGRNFELCRESFIRIGSINNSDLSPRKRERLVNIFMDKCKNMFEDNLRVLNSLVCDWPISGDALKDRNKRQLWTSMSRDCRITKETITENVWSALQNDTLDEILFTLGPNNLCSVVPLNFWDDVTIGIENFDRMIWTLKKIDRIVTAPSSGRKIEGGEYRNRQCLEKIVPKLKKAIEKRIDLFQYDTSTIPCQDILILKNLNKYLSHDLLVTASANKKDQRVNCINLIGSNHEWFTANQLINFVKHLEEQHSKIFATIEEIESPQLSGGGAGLVIQWKLSNLIPYLNATSTKRILSQISTVGSSIYAKQQKDPILTFLANLKWPTKPENSEAAREILEYFKLSLANNNTEEKISMLGNILCSLPNYHTARDFQYLSQNYYCTEPGQLKKSRVRFARNLSGSYLLMDQNNVKLKQTMEGKIVDVDKLPQVFVKANARQILTTSLDKISIEQASYLLEINQSQWNDYQREKLLAIVDSGEMIEEKIVEAENEKEKSSNDDADNDEDQQIDLSYSDGEQNGAPFIRSVEIIYITANTYKHHLSNSLLLIVVSMKTSLNLF